MQSKILIGTLIGLLIGLFLGQKSLHDRTFETIDSYVGDDEVAIVGMVVEEPDVRRDKTKLTIRAQSVDTNKNVDGLVLVSTEKYPAYRFGDELEIIGKLEKPVVFEEFDYAGYLSRFDIYAVMNRPKIIKITSPKTSLYSLLLSLKKSFQSHLNLTFPTEPSSSLMAGLVLGSRKGMPEDLTKDFQITGLSHIVAISGYNITLVVTILMAMFRSLGRRISIGLSAGGVILFTLFVGASAAVVRACIMGLISLLAISSERKTNVTIVLLIAATIMGAWNPKILTFDVGFQLSFLATMGLIYIYPLIISYFEWLPEKFAVRESITMTLSAQIMALPILILNFHQLSLISPISNVLVAGPIIPFTMFFGFAGTMVSYLSITLAKIVSFPGYLLSEYITQIIHLCAQIPYAAIEITGFSESFLMLYFTTLSIVILKSRKMVQTIDRHITRYQLTFQQNIAHLTRTHDSVAFPSHDGVR